MFEIVNLFCYHRKFRIFGELSNRKYLSSYNLFIHKNPWVVLALECLQEVVNKTILEPSINKNPLGCSWSILHFIYKNPRGCFCVH